MNSLTPAVAAEEGVSRKLMKDAEGPREWEMEGRREQWDGRRERERRRGESFAGEPGWTRAAQRAMDGEDMVRLAGERRTRGGV